MLVKKSIVEKWYQTDSWVYKNFAYLFQNPLWDNNIPSGFSVCPYFWLNIFSLFIFRPFVVFPLNYLIIPLIKWIGSPAVKFDKFLGKLFRLDSNNKGAGIGILLVLFILLAIVIFLGIAAVQGLMQFYPYITSSSLGTFSFWSITSFISLWGVIGLHKAITKTECKTISYLWVWLVLFIPAALIFIHPEMISASSSIWNALTSVGSDLGNWIWIGLKYAGWGLWKGASWTPVSALYVPWWVYIFTAAAGAWLMDVIASKFESSRVETLRTQLSENYWNRNRNAWIGLFTQTLMQSKLWKEGWIFIDDSNNYDGNMGDKSYAQSCSFYRQSIYKKAFEIVLGNELTELQKHYPIVVQDKWTKLEKYDNFNDRFFSLPGTLNGEYPKFSFTKESFKLAIYEALKSPEIKEYVERYAEQIRQDAKQRSERITAKRMSWSHRMCLMVTGGISNGVKRTGRGIGSFSGQIGTFFVYLWMLIKAKKQGACPYFRFTNPNDKK